MKISRDVLIVAAGWLFHDEWALHLGHNKEMTPETLYDLLDEFHKALVENMVRQILEAAEHGVYPTTAACQQNYHDLLIMQNYKSCPVCDQPLGG